MTKEINLKVLLKVLKNSWWKILIFTVAITIAVGAVIQFLVPKKYASTIEFYVLNTSTTSEYTTTALLSAAEYLSNDYIKIINSDRMMEKIREYLADPNRGYDDVSVSDVRGMISSSTSTESSTFTITVTATEDKVLAMYVAEAITKYAPEIIKDITRPSYTSNLYKQVVTKDEAGKEEKEYVKINEIDLECVKVIREPQLATTHASPNVIMYTAIAAILAAVVSYVFFLILKLADTTIRSEENTKELVDGTIIGDIPNWTVNTETDKEEK